LINQSVNWSTDWNQADCWTRTC